MRKQQQGSRRLYTSVLFSEPAVGVDGDQWNNLEEFGANIEADVESISSNATQLASTQLIDDLLYYAVNPAYPHPAIEEVVKQKGFTDWHMTITENSGLVSPIRSLAMSDPEPAGLSPNHGVDDRCILVTATQRDDQHRLAAIFSPSTKDVDIEGENTNEGIPQRSSKPVEASSGTELTIVAMIRVTTPYGEATRKITPDSGSDTDDDSPFVPGLCRSDRPKLAPGAIVTPPLSSSPQSALSPIAGSPVGLSQPRKRQSSKKKKMCCSIIR
ncbi:hypothetical protein EV356DRAFT_520596 [Viridothelium virens]|uniref:Uncharacterized protein n=1 Tax=Viridothelium virens TaxID=1048519 RepID=A0A6A6GW59_VIRVR|nr:hypothetical protein EV356DRAFT_520596 [Viridothelium virens]